LTNELILRTPKTEELNCSQNRFLFKPIDRLKLGSTKSPKSREIKGYAPPKVEEFQPIATEP